MATNNSIMLAERTDELLNRGRSQGFLSTEEVADLLQEGDLSAVEVEEFYATLEEEEITVVERRGRARPAEDPGCGGGSGGAGDACDADSPRRRHGRLHPDVPRGDRQGAAPDPRRRDKARQGHRPRLQEVQGQARRGQPQARRLHSQEVPQPRGLFPGPHPGGQPRAHQGGREVRPLQGLQVLDLRDVVDPPGHNPGHSRQGAHHPHPRPHGREGQQVPPDAPAHDPDPRPRALRGGDSARARRLRRGDTAPAGDQPEVHQPRDPGRRRRLLGAWRLSRGRGLRHPDGRGLRVPA